MAGWGIMAIETINSLIAESNVAMDAIASAGEVDGGAQTLHDFYRLVRGSVVNREMRNIAMAQAERGAANLINVAKGAAAATAGVAVVQRLGRGRFQLQDPSANPFGFTEPVHNQIPAPPVIPPIQPVDPSNPARMVANRNKRSRKPRRKLRRKKKSKKKAPSLRSRVLAIINPPSKHYSLVSDTIASTMNNFRNWFPGTDVETQTMSLGTQDDIASLETILGLSNNQTMMIISGKATYTFHNPTNAIMTVTVWDFGYKKDVLVGTTVGAAYTVTDIMNSGIAQQKDVAETPYITDIGFTKPFGSELMKQVFSCRKPNGFTFQLAPGVAKHFLIRLKPKYMVPHQFEDYSSTAYSHYAGYTRTLVCSVIGDICNDHFVDEAGFTGTNIQVVVKKEWVFTASDNKAMELGGDQTLPAISAAFVRRHDGPSEAFEPRP